MRLVALCWSVVLAAGCVADAGASDEPGGLRLPGEFEPVDELLVTWDHGEDLEPMFAQLVAEASWSTRVVVVLARDEIADDVREAVSDAGGDIDQVKMLHSERDSLWLRDFGPLVVHDGYRRRVYDFEYFGERVDDRLARTIARRRWARRSTEIGLRLEGGNLISNGAGVCLTSDIALSDNRGRGEAGVRRILAQKLGCKELLILPALDGEGTGHVDMYLTLAGPRHALVGRYSRRVDRENSRRLDRAARILKAAGFSVTRLPMPDPDGDVFRTYANAVPVNDLVLVPIYDDDTRGEKEALAIFARAFPERRIVAVESSNLIDLDGALHCVTMSVAR